MKKNNILVLTIVFITCLLSTLVHAKSTDNGACSSPSLENTACVEITNTGDIDISIKVHLLHENGVRVATSGQQSSYQYKALRGRESFVLKPNYTNALLDTSCNLFDWAAQLAQGDNVVISDLTTGIYAYQFGYKLDLDSGRYMMVNCR